MKSIKWRVALPSLPSVCTLERPSGRLPATAQCLLPWCGISAGWELTFMLWGGREGAANEAAFLPLERYVCFVFRQRHSRARCLVSQCQKFAYPSLMASADMTRGGKRGKKRSHVAAKPGRAGRRGKAELADKQTKGKKSALTFHQCNFRLLCARPAACQAGSISSWGRKKKKKERDALMANAIGRSLCPTSVFMGTLDRRVWERGLRRKGTDREKKKVRTQAGAINHVSDALTHS